MQIDEQIPDVRPGFTCSAEITTATRKQVAVGADSGDGRRARSSTTRAAQIVREPKDPKAKRQPRRSDAAGGRRPS